MPTGRRSRRRCAGRLVLLTTRGDMRLARGARSSRTTSCCSDRKARACRPRSTTRADLRVRIPQVAGHPVLEYRGRGGHRARRGAEADGRTGRNDRARRRAAGGARLVRIAARPDLRRVRGDRARGGQRRALRLHRPGTASDPDGAPGGGGVRGRDEGQGVREGRGQRLDRRRRASARNSPRPSTAPARTRSFFATGISLVAHMANPHVPAVHMNTRFLATTKRWFGGGADLNPPIPYEEDTADFHARLRAACAAHDPTYYDALHEMGGRLFLHPPSRRPSRRRRHLLRSSRRRRLRARNFAFTRDVGEAFLDVFPRLVRRRMDDAVRRGRQGARSSNGAAAMPSST